MIAGVDIGGTKIAVAVSLGDGQTWLKSLATPKGDYSLLLRTLKDAVAAAEAECGAIDLVGVGAPGTISPVTDLVRNSNLESMNGRAFARDLESALQRPVRVTNDANCFAIYEARAGAGAGADVMFAATLGTGVGGSVCIDARPWPGADGLGGEWGHNPLPWPTVDELSAPVCYCGRRGCIEQFLSGTGMAAEFLRLNGRAAVATEILTSGEPACAQARARYLERLARALATVINLLDPQVIVLGGGLSAFDDIYVCVPNLWADWVFGGQTTTRLLKASGGASSGALGAAMLWS